MEYPNILANFTIKLLKNREMICIYHSRDMDGWMSGAIVKLKYPDVESIGWDYGQPIPDLSAHNKVIMCDISFPLANMDLIASGVSNVQNDFIWIDHHISAIKECSFEVDGKYIAGYGGIRDTKFSACELTWKYFFPDIKMPELVRLLGRYDCFGHKGTEEELKVLEFQYGARQEITNIEDAYAMLIVAKGRGDWDMDGDLCEEIHGKGRAVYKYLCVEAKQKYDKKFEIWLDDKLFACVNDWRLNPINFGINYHQDGYDGFACFWYENGQFTYSLYNDNGVVDCSAIARSNASRG